MERILSNERWFIRLIYFRTAILVILLLAVLLLLISADTKTGTSQLWSVLVVSLLLTIVLWQQLQRPSYLEVFVHRDALLIRLYIPDNRFLFFLQRKHIRTFIVHPQDELRIHGQFGYWPWSRKLQFVVARPDGSQWRSDILDISWATAKQWERLQRLPDLLCA